MINFHGCHASTGEERTFPNEMTREGIRGLEVNKMREGPLTASHNAALPFTRFVVGQADYTPILFTNPGPTTWAHQLATLVTFTTGLQTLAEHPKTMMNAPIIKDAFPVMKRIPSVWDETIVLEGSEIGRLAAFARRSGDVWFVGILNGGEVREYEIDLSFLDATGNYQATTIADDLDAAAVDVAEIGVNTKADRKKWTTTVPFKTQSSTVNDKTRLKVRLAEGGGFVAKFSKQ